MTKQLSMDAVRRSNRYRVLLNLPVRLGLKSGTLVDISVAGALATHPGVLKTGSTVDLAFTYDNHSFAGTAKVASCTVVGLGGGETTMYASRLYFESLTEPAKQIIETLFGGGS